MASALKDVNLGGKAHTNVIYPVEMVHLEWIACITAVETARVMKRVTRHTEYASNVPLDGKMIIVTKLAMLDRTGQTVKKHVDVVSRLTIVPLLTELVLVVARTDTQEIHVMNVYKVYIKNLNHRVLQSSPLLSSSLLC